MKNIDCDLYELESYGKGCFARGIEYLSFQEYDSALSCFIEGLDSVTCTCNKNNWLTNKEDIITEFIENNYYDNDNESSYYFSKAFVLSYADEQEVLLIALESAVKYQRIVCVNNVEDEYSNYLIGKILSKLDYPNFALHYFKYILKYCNSKNPARINYMIGRMMEDNGIGKECIYTSKTQIYPVGLRYLSNALLDNCSSICCALNLQLDAKKANLNYLFKESYSSNELIQQFINSEDGVEFIRNYKNIVKSCSEYDYYSDRENKKILIDFLDFIALNSDTFQSQEEYEFEKTYMKRIKDLIREEEPPLYILFPDYFGENKIENPPENRHFGIGYLNNTFRIIEEMNEPSEYEEFPEDEYEKEDSIKSKYNNNYYSDDIIDDVFDGDPLNTWNID